MYMLSVCSTSHTLMFKLVFIQKEKYQTKVYYSAPKRVLCLCLQVPTTLTTE